MRRLAPRLALAAGLAVAALSARAQPRAPAGPSGTVFRRDCTGAALPARDVTVGLFVQPKHGRPYRIDRAGVGRDGAFAFRRAAEPGRFLAVEAGDQVFAPAQQVIVSGDDRADFVATASPVQCRLVALFDAGALLPAQGGGALASLARGLRDQVANGLYSGYEPGVNDEPKRFRATSAMLRQFQWEHDHYQSGRADPETLAELMSPAAFQKLAEGSPADAGPLSLGILVELLRGAGADLPATVTVFDGRLTDALRAFQIERGIYPSGVATVRTVAALRAAQSTPRPRVRAPADDAMASLPVFLSQYANTVFNPVAKLGLPNDNCGPSSMAMALALWGFERRGLGGEELTPQERIDWARALINADTKPVRDFLAKGVTDALGGHIPDPAGLGAATPLLLREGVTADTLSRVARAGGVTTPVGAAVVSAFAAPFSKKDGASVDVLDATGNLRLVHGLLLLDAHAQTLDDDQLDAGLVQANLWAQAQHPARTITHGIVSGPPAKDGWASLDDHLKRGPVLVIGVASSGLGEDSNNGNPWTRHFPVPTAYGGLLPHGRTIHIIAILGKTADQRYVVADPLYASYRTWPGMGDGGGPVTMTADDLKAFIIVFPDFVWLEATPSCTDVALVNPSFEDPPISGPWVRVSAIPGWTGPVDVHRDPDLPASEGAQVVDLNQNDAGWIAQSFPTVPGADYRIEFFAGVNYHCTGSASFAVQIDGETIQTLSADEKPADHVVTFTARRETTELRFVSLTGGCGATTLDRVSVTCDPAP